MVSSVSVVDFDFLTGAELDRRSFFIPIVFFLSSEIIGGFLIVEIIFFEFFLILLLFEFVSVSDVSDSELLNDGLIIIVLRREVFDWGFRIDFESTDNLLRD